jgi:hypothetical protein
MDSQMKFKEIRRVIKSKKEHDFGNSWPVNRSDAFDYFSKHPKLYDLIIKEISGWDPYKEEIIYLDIAGRATFEQNNTEKMFTEQYSFSLAGTLYNEHTETDNQIIGDIFSDDDFGGMIKFFKSQSKKLSLVTFNPVGGLY